ncbi:hypothetical protein ACJRO7_017066 [Eucalyptus globulus]|uniref:Uncharacterized protein n=1 Tax=Eucalyptus globulus TaxID=34317 RepID=A0ABD3L086_EUCGL
MHSNFFSSLKGVKRRLELNRHNLRRYRPPPQTTIASSSLNRTPISPLYLLSSRLHHRHRLALDPPSPPPPLQDSSKAPNAFLSCSPQFRPPPESPPLPLPVTETNTDSANDIDRLMRMLGLGNCEPKPCGEGAGCGGGTGACECTGGFYEHVTSVKGPKCQKEAERLDAWIEYFSNGGCGGDEDERAEPLRLVHLLLGRAASACMDGGGCGSGGLVFPSTVDEFLRNDPPGPDD